MPNVSNIRSQKIYINTKETENIPRTQIERNNRDSCPLSELIIQQQDSGSREYKDLILANENISNNINNDDNTIRPNVRGVYKIGTYFIKKSLLTPTNDDNEISLLRKKPATTIINIEKADVPVEGDPQYLVEYARDIFAHLKKVEGINTAKYGYMATVQSDITDKMRSVLIDWIIEVIHFLTYYRFI